IDLLIYFAYLILRNSLPDLNQRARIGAVNNIFAFAAFIPLRLILPRLTDSLRPGNGGNPGFNAYDIDSSLRMVFYPAVIGWTLLGTWISTIRVRQRRLEIKFEDKMVNQISMKKWMVVVLLFISLQVMSQEKIEIKTEDYQNFEVEMADAMRSEGKIFVLVGI